MVNYDYQELARQLGFTGRLSGDEILGRCPMPDHQDRSPSFSLNIVSGNWNCFSRCGGGGFISLIRATQGLGVIEAHDWLLRAASLMPVSNPTAIKVDITPVQDLRWLEHFKAIDRTIMPQWWFDRGFTWETAEYWDIRWDDDSKQLVIPFYTYRGSPQILGTITRNFLRGPKYVNSPNLPRSEYLFGWAQPVGPLILCVESALDAIKLQELGYPAVALLGLNMSNKHAVMMNNFTEVCIALDMDDAGIVAADSIKHRLLNSGRLMSQVTRLELPDGRKDVGECDQLELADALQNRRIA